jgi:hypothetical protein
MLTSKKRKNSSLAKNKSFIESATWVDFNKILCAAFMRANPKSIKKTDCLTVFFGLLGSANIKVAPKMLVKLTPGISQTKLYFSLFSFFRS